MEISSNKISLGKQYYIFKSIRLGYLAPYFSYFSFLVFHWQADLQTIFHNDQRECLLCLSSRPTKEAQNNMYESYACAKSTILSQSLEDPWAQGKKWSALDSSATFCSQFDIFLIRTPSKTYNINLMTAIKELKSLSGMLTLKKTKCIHLCREKSDKKNQVTWHTVKIQPAF